MPFDNLCKLIAEKHPERFTEWILGTVPASVEILKSELSIEPIRADSVTFLQTTNRVPITQVVVVLLPSSDSTSIETAFELETTRHEFQVIKLWEHDPAEFLQDPVLLPFAVFAQTQNPEALLLQVAQQVRGISPSQQQQEVSSYVQLMAGLKYDKREVRRIFREGMMRESVIYQEILQEGRQEGRQEGEQLAIERIAVNMLLKQMPPHTIAELTGLTIDQIQQLQTRSV